MNIYIKYFPERSVYSLQIIHPEFKRKIKEFFRYDLPEFFKKCFKSTKTAYNNNFEITTRKPLLIIGAILFVASLLLVILRLSAFDALKDDSRSSLIIFDFALPFLIGTVAIFNLKIKKEKLRKILSIIAFIIMPFIMTAIAECLNGINIFNMKILPILGNCAVISIFYFIAFALSGSLAFTFTFINSVLFGLAVAHSYVMDFRGSPFLPMDFFNAGTAAGVADAYNFAPSYKLVTAILLFAFITIINVKMRTPKFTLLTKIISRSSLATVSAVVMILFYGTSTFVNMGVAPYFWNQGQAYQRNGFIYNFFINTKYLYMSEPSGYDSDKIKDYIDQTIDPNPNPNPSTVQPNIICIMNESLSDLSVLGNLETNLEYMPFMNSLTENTIKGNLLVPVIGGGTSNTEFEFLTGHSTHFLPPGSNAYMLYVKNPMASLVSTLKAQNYSAWAFHPYLASGWNRPSVYGLFGFEKFTAFEDVFDMSLWKKYESNGSKPNYLQKLVDEKYPGSNMLLRQYISDEYDYRLLIENYENRDKTKPYFAFNVTMQNHGGYTSGCVNFNESIYATSTSKDYTKANKYLSLVRASDTAFKELIEYFSKVKEPTIICMFGDHQPNVEPEFVSEVLGGKNINNLTVEDEQKRYTTPFFIWANYDIEEKTIPYLSVNYLSSLVLKTAGVELSEYNKYLLKLSETLPVINTAGYIDAEGNYYKWSDNSEYDEIIREYERIQYNCIFDQKNIDKGVFFLQNYDHKPTDLSRNE